MLKNKVYEILGEFPNTRNSDILLRHEIIRKFYPNYIYNVNGQEYISFASEYELPREDNVKRIRAKIQNELGEFLPTSWAVAKKRGIKEQEWKNALGYLTKGHDTQEAIKNHKELDNRLFELGGYR